MKRLLIYTNPLEPISEIIIKHKKRLKIKTLFVKDLLDKAIIYDEFDKDRTKIRWFLPNRQKITNSNDLFVINRAFWLPHEWFSDFQKEDQEYAKNEFWAYLVFALNSFPNINEKTGANSLTGNCYSLTDQWKIIEKNIQDLHTPDFYFGPIDFLPREWKTKAIFTNPYRYYFWKVNQCDPKNYDNVFAIRKPIGKPILLLKVKESITVYYLNNTNIEVEHNLKVKLTKLGKSLGRIFEFWICEILFFVDNNRVTIGMIYNYPNASRRLKNFEKLILSSILKN